MLKTLFFLALTAMPLSVFSQVPSGESPLPVRCTSGPDARTAAWFKASANKAQLSTHIITVKPEGEEHAHRIRSGFGINQQRGAYGSIDYLDGSYVKDSKGNVYLYNPIMLFPTYSYLKLEPFNGDTLVCRTPQPIANIYGTVCYATRLKAQISDGGLAYVLDVPDGATQPNLDIKFVLRGDSLYQVPDDYITFPGTTVQVPSVLLGVTDATGMWLTMGEANTALRPCPYSPTMLPAGVKSEPFNLYSLDSDNDTVRYTTEVAIDGNDVYMTNPYSPDTLQWIHGTLSGGKATFLPQYIGVDKRSNLHLSFLPATYTTQTSPDGTIIYNYVKAPTLTFDYDAQARTLATDPQARVAFLINAGLDEVNAIMGYRNPSLTIFPVQAATPADPKIVQLQAYDEDMGMGFLSVDFYPIDTQNRPLPYTRLFYNIYLDDQLLTVGPPYYNNVSTPFTNIASNYADNEYFFTQQEIHNVYLTRPFEKVGVQVLFKYNDQWYKSNLVSQTVEGTGVNELAHDAGVPVRQEWYDLSGRRIARPSQGLYLKVSRYADGSVKTEKVMLR